MSNNKTKEYLQDILDWDEEIQKLVDERDELYTIATSINVGYNTDNVQGNAPQDKLADIVSKIADLDAEIDRRIDRLSNRKMKVRKSIDAMDSFKERECLRMKYLEKRKPYEIADELNISEKHVYKLQKKAIEHITATIFCDKKQ